MKKIMLIDDEDDVRSIVSGMLSHIYDIDSKNDPDIALDVFKQSPETFDLVITDMNLGIGRINGIDLSANMLQVRKDIPIILFTGYGSYMGRGLSRSVPIAKCVTKPISQEKLLDIIKDIIG